MNSEEIENKEISVAERERILEQKIGITWRDKVDTLIDNLKFSLDLHLLIEESKIYKGNPEYFINRMDLFLKECEELVGHFAYLATYKELFSILEDIEDKTYGMELFKLYEDAYEDEIFLELDQEAQRHDIFIAEPIYKEVSYIHKLVWRGYAFDYAMDKLQTISYIKQVKEDCDRKEYPQTIQNLLTYVNIALRPKGIVLPRILDSQRKIELDKFKICKKVLDKELDRCINANSEPTTSDTNQIQPQNKKLTRQQIEMEDIILPVGAFGLMMWYLNKVGVFDKVVSEKMTLNQQKVILAKIGYTTPNAMSNVYCKPSNDILKKDKVSKQKIKVQDSITKPLINSLEIVNYNDDFRKFEPMEKMALMKCLGVLGYIYKDLEPEVKFKCLQELMTLPENIDFVKEWKDPFPCDPKNKTTDIKIRLFFTELNDLLQQKPIV